MTQKEIDALYHAKARFERLAEEADEAGDTVQWAMCSVDARMMQDVIGVTENQRGTNEPVA